MTNIIWTGGEAELGSKCVVGLDRDGVINVDLGTYVTHPAYRDWETDRKSTRLNSSHRL